MPRSVPIGLTNVHYAIMISDTAGVSATYQTPVRIPGAISANFSPSASNDTLFADDGPYDTASTLGAMSLELNVADLPASVRAALLGHAYAANGLLVHKSTDTPPFVAIGMSVLKSNGHSRYLWYLKGKFADPDDNNQTKADSINWNTPTITGNFLKRDFDNQWKITADTDDVLVNPGVITNWFTTPNVETLAPSVEYVLTITKTGVGTIWVNNIEYTAPISFGEGDVVAIRFSAVPTVFTIGGTSKTADIENKVFAMAMPAAATAVAVTFA